MLHPNDITGIVLAGGRSSRFGSNKALSEFSGKSFLQNSVELLIPYTQQVVVSGSYPEYETLQLPVLKDEIPGIGPMGGIYTALKQCTTDWFLILTCDMPLISAPIITQMLNAYDQGDVIGWNQGENGGPFPLLISKDVIQWIEKNIREKKYSVKQLFQWKKSYCLNISDEWSSCFVNINTLHDYKKIVT